MLKSYEQNLSISAVAAYGQSASTVAEQAAVKRSAKLTSQIAELENSLKNYSSRQVNELAKGDVARVRHLGLAAREEMCSMRRGFQKPSLLTLRQMQKVYDSLFGRGIDLLNASWEYIRQAEAAQNELSKLGLSGSVSERGNIPKLQQFSKLSRKQARHLADDGKVCVRAAAEVKELGQKTMQFAAEQRLRWADETRSEPRPKGPARKSPLSRTSF